MCITDLIKQLQRLNNTGDSKRLNDLKTSAEFSASTAYKLQAYASAAEKSEKTIDPEIEKQRKKLPIFQKKDELIQV